VSPFRLYPDFIGLDEAPDLHRLVLEALESGKKSYGSRSRVRRWGPWAWSHKPPHPEPVDMGPFPGWLEGVRSRVDALAGVGPSDSASLNEFPGGKGVKPHVESRVFEDYFASVSLGDGVLRLYGASPSEFRSGSDPGPLVAELTIPSRSLYVVCQPVVHSFTAELGTRYSIVFRKLRTV
jgi:hypothetical protein